MMFLPVLLAENMPSVAARWSCEMVEKDIAIPRRKCDNIEEIFRRSAFLRTYEGDLRRLLRRSLRFINCAAKRIR